MLKKQEDEAIATDADERSTLYAVAVAQRHGRALRFVRALARLTVHRATLYTNGRARHGVSGAACAQVR